MIYEYAIAPELFSEVNSVQVLQASLGLDHGRIFSEVPRKEWLRTVFSLINTTDYKPVMRKSLKNAAKKLVALAGHKRQEQPDSIEAAWLDTVTQAHNKKPFRAILVQEYHGDRSDILCVNLSLHEQELWQAPGTVLVEREAEKMVVAVQSMLDCASEVILVDRNFSPDKMRFVNVLLSFFEAISTRNAGTVISKITYHLGDKLSNDELKRLCERHVIPRMLIGTNLDMVVRPWGELHDRIVLTDVGGVTFGVGLDEALGGGVDNVRIVRMTKDDYRKEWKLAKKAKVSFSLTKRVKIATS